MANSDMFGFPKAGMPTLKDDGDRFCLNTLYDRPLKPAGFVVDIVGANRLLGALTIGGALTGASTGAFSGAVSTDALTAAGITGTSLALGVGSITLTGSVGTVLRRSLKGWFKDLDLLNPPTVGEDRVALMGDLTRFAPVTEPLSLHLDCSNDPLTGDLDYGTHKAFGLSGLESTGSSAWGGSPYNLFRTSAIPNPFGIGGNLYSNWTYAFATTDLPFATISKLTNSGTTAATAGYHGAGGLFWATDTATANAVHMLFGVEGRVDGLGRNTSYIGINGLANWWGHNTTYAGMMVGVQGAVNIYKLDQSTPLAQGTAISFFAPAIVGGADNYSFMGSNVVKVSADNVSTTRTSRIKLSNATTGSVQLAPVIEWDTNPYLGADFPTIWKLGPSNTDTVGASFSLTCEIPSIALSVEPMRFFYDGSVYFSNNLTTTGTGTFGSAYLATDAGKYYCGAGNDMSIDYDGTQGNIKTDLVAPSDLHIDCGTDKTIVLDETVWDDFPPNPIVAAKLGSTAPTLATFVTDIEQYTFDATNDYVIGSTEIPHNWKEGTVIYPHIHWATNGTNASDRGVQWQLKWTVGDAMETFSAQTTSVVDATIPLATADRTHFISEFGTTLNGANLKIGAVICWRLGRIATAHANGAPANDPFALSIGFHGEMDTVGSRERTTK